MKKWLFVCVLVLSSLAHGQNIPPPSPVEDSPAPEAITPKSDTSTTSSNTSSQQTSSSTNAMGDESAIPSHFRPDPVSFNARLGTGASFGPDAFWLTGDAEVQFDKFIAFGPKIQWGISSSTDFFYTTLGPRFTLPIDIAEFGVQTGAGLAYRNVSGFEFFNFVLETTFNIDFYILKNLSVGPSYTLNFLSSQAESFMQALVLAVSGHF